MKQIEKDELYQHLGQFLKRKGIELQDGSYSRRIQQGCHLLADAINLSQKGLARAKTEFDQGLERMRQVIHEKTAPKAPPAGAAGKGTSASGGAAAAAAGRPRAKASGKRGKGRAGGGKAKGL
jgi:hypothetical protein